MTFGILALGFLVSEVLQVSQVLQPWGAHSLTFFPILMYSFGDVWHPGSGVRLASWLWGSLFRRFRRFCSLWGLTVSLSSLFFPILMHSLGDVWHPGPGGSLFRRFCRFRRFCSLWRLTVSLSSLFFPILMHSLGDVWHPGSGVPCFAGFAGFAGFAAFGGSQTVSLSSLS